MDGEPMKLSEDPLKTCDACQVSLEHVERMPNGKLYCIACRRVYRAAVEFGKKDDLVFVPEVLMGEACSGCNCYGRPLEDKLCEDCIKVRARVGELLRKKVREHERRVLEEVLGHEMPDCESCGCSFIDDHKDDCIKLIEFNKLLKGVNNGSD